MTRRRASHTTLSALLVLTCCGKSAGDEPAKPAPAPAPAAAAAPTAPAPAPVSPAIVAAEAKYERTHAEIQAKEEVPRKALAAIHVENEALAKDLDAIGKEPPAKTQAESNAHMMRLNALVRRQEDVGNRQNERMKELDELRAEDREALAELLAAKHAAPQ